MKNKKIVALCLGVTNILSCHPMAFALSERKEIVQADKDTSFLQNSFAQLIQSIDAGAFQDQNLNEVQARLSAALNQNLLLCQKLNDILIQNKQMTSIEPYAALSKKVMKSARHESKSSDHLMASFSHQVQSLLHLQQSWNKDSAQIQQQLQSTLQQYQQLLSLVRSLSTSDASVVGPSFDPQKLLDQVLLLKNNLIKVSNDIFQINLAYKDKSSKLQKDFQKTKTQWSSEKSKIPSSLLNLLAESQHLLQDSTKAQELTVDHWNQYLDSLVSESAPSLPFSSKKSPSTTTGSLNRKSSWMVAQNGDRPSGMRLSDHEYNQDFHDISLDTEGHPVEKRDIEKHAEVGLLVGGAYLGLKIYDEEHGDVITTDSRQSILDMGRFDEIDLDDHQAIRERTTVISDYKKDKLRMDRKRIARVSGFCGIMAAFAVAGYFIYEHNHEISSSARTDGRNK